MPLHEADGPFVAAIVATVTKPANLGQVKKNSSAWLVGKLRENSACPFVVYVKPGSGYGQAADGKFTKMEIMARYRKLLTGKGTLIRLGEGGRRNFVWSHAMVQAVARAAVRHAFEGPIERLEIALDQKTFAKEQKALPMKSFLLLPRQVQDIVEECSWIDPAAARSFRANFRVTKQSISVCWSNEPAAAGSEMGLTLADRLAHHYYRHLTGRNGNSFELQMQAAGFRDLALDITQLITRPMNRQVVERWKMDTGLPELQG